jgi:hypothetical protein
VIVFGPALNSQHGAVFPSFTQAAATFFGIVSILRIDLLPLKQFSIGFYSFPALFQETSVRHRRITM